MAIWKQQPFFFREKKIRHMTRAESWQQFMAVNHGYCLPKLSQDRGFIFQRWTQI